MNGDQVEFPRQHRQRIVAGTVIDHRYFEMGVMQSEESAYTLCDGSRFIKCRRQNGDGGGLPPKPADFRGFPPTNLIDELNRFAVVGFAKQSYALVLPGPFQAARSWRAMRAPVTSPPQAGAAPCPGARRTPRAAPSGSFEVRPSNLLLTRPSGRANPQLVKHPR